MKCTMSPTSACLTPILRSTTGSLYAAYPGTYNLYLFDPPTPPIWNYCAHMPRSVSVASLLCNSVFIKLYLHDQLLLRGLQPPCQQQLQISVKVELIAAYIT